MRFSNPYLVLMLAVLITVVSCRPKPANNSTLLTDNQDFIKYAKGFDIVYHDTHIELQILNPYLDAAETIVIAINPPGMKGVEGGISTPLETVVVTSTTHIPFLEMLGVESTLAGFPNTMYISSEKTRARIDANQVRDLGNEENINTELLMALKPDAVIGFSLYGNNRMYATIAKLGVPVLLNGDWLEETPLGRAEWIKFFGVLYNKMDEADRLFTSIEQSYNAAQQIAASAGTVPSVISGGLFKDIWNLPAGDSFEATFLDHANMNYLYKDSKGKGSLNLTVEAVYENAHEADIWISPSFHESLESMANANEIYTKFKAFNKRKVYSFVKRKGASGGIIYFELAPARPDLVLKDLIKIAHPELLGTYATTFFDPLD